MRLTVEKLKDIQLLSNLELIGIISPRKYPKDVERYCCEHGITMARDRQSKSRKVKFILQTVMEI